MKWLFERCSEKWAHESIRGAAWPYEGLEAEERLAGAADELTGS
jgi:hypothetical protein